MLLELCEKRSGRAGTRGWLWAQGPMAAAGGETVTQEAASPAEEAVWQDTPAGSSESSVSLGLETSAKAGLFRVIDRSL